VPLSSGLSGANRPDGEFLISLIDAIPKIKGKVGAPLFRPGCVVADKAYTWRSNIVALGIRGIEAWLPEKGTDEGRHLGVFRWVVEPTIAWLHQFRRLRVRYERRADIYQAFLTLGCIVILARVRFRARHLALRQQDWSLLRSGKRYQAGKPQGCRRDYEQRANSVAAPHRLRPPLERRLLHHSALLWYKSSRRKERIAALSGDNPETLRRETMGHLRYAFAVAAFAGSPALADITFFTDHEAFTEFNVLDGKFLKGIEDFEESTVGVGDKIPFPNSLQNGVPRPTFDFGIDATNLIIQTNVTFGPCPPTPNPSSSPTALWVNGPGFIGSNSVKIGTDEFLTNDFSSIDLIFTTHDKTGVGVDVSTYQGFNAGHNGFIFCVYDQFDNILGTFAMGPNPSEPDKNFFGVWSAIPIGRVNVWGIFTQPQPFAVDNIEMWVPAPGALAMLGLGGIAAMRRRR